MRRRLIFAFVIGLYACFNSPLAAQEVDEQEMAAMMERWQEFMTPGEHHELLAKKAGSWDMQVKMFGLTPDMPAQESTGKSQAKMIMDGRYLMDHIDGSFQGMPFKGMGISGFDNQSKKFRSIWIDNMGTSFMVAEGTFDAETSTWHYTATTPDPMTGETVEVRSTEQLVNDDKWIMTTFRPGPDGKEMKQMEIVYTRAAED